MSFLTDALASLRGHPVALPAVQLLLLALAALLAYLLSRSILARLIDRTVRLTRARWDDALLDSGVISRLAHVVPALVVYYGSAALPVVPDGALPMIRRIASVYLIVAVMAAIMSLLGALGRVYEQYQPQRARIRPIKSYVQLAQILVTLVAAVFIAAALFDRDPLLILSGLGALTAVLMLIFKDTIQSFVASVQITSHDMLRVGDWIEMPQIQVDGHAIDMSLHTVKVQNMDHSITTIPTWRLITESFRNWRGMFESGARLIQRALLLDQTSIHFLRAEEWEAMHRFAQIDERRRVELIAAAGRDPLETQRSTNAGMFRAYVRAYLRTHPQVRQDLQVQVRQLPPGPTGLPIEIYCFTTTDWERYENVQAEIFEHLLSILPEFGLRMFQQPGGTGQTPSSTTERHRRAVRHL